MSNALANTDALQALLAAADVLRAATSAPDSRGAAYRRSSLGLAGLIESWCVDNAEWLTPGLVIDLTPADRETDAAMLDALRVRLDRVTAAA